MVLYRWRIGLGDSICVWKDKWVPGLKSFKISSPPGVLHELAMVHQLMSLTTGIWDENLIRRVFNYNKANAVLGIIMCSKCNPNNLVWHFSPDREYKTRIGYKVARSWLNGQAMVLTVFVENS